MSFQKFIYRSHRYISPRRIHHAYYAPIRCQLYTVSRYKFSDKQPQEDKEEEPQYTRTQMMLQYLAYALMISISAGSMIFFYNFQKYYVKPRQKLFKQEVLTLNGKTRDKMIKDMANKFQENMEFKTHEDEVIKGLDVLKNNKFFVLYCGYPDCKDKCDDILKIIQSALMSDKLQKHKDLLSILYIDLNLFDTPQKLNAYLMDLLNVKPDTESNINFMGLIPHNRETLRELMDAFCIHIERKSGDGINMQLHHSNIVYFVDVDGLLYEILGSEQDPVNIENIIDTTNKLLYHSESTWSGKLRNAFSLIFQTKQIRQIPDRHAKSQIVPS